MIIQIFKLKELGIFFSLLIWLTETLSQPSHQNDLYIKIPFKEQTEKESVENENITVSIKSGRNYYTDLVIDSTGISISATTFFIVGGVYDSLKVSSFFCFIQIDLKIGETFYVIYITNIKSGLRMYYIDSLVDLEPINYYLLPPIKHEIQEIRIGNWVNQGVDLTKYRLKN
jgi:hypothetical protein